MKWISVKDKLPEDKQVIDVLMVNFIRKTDVTFDASVWQKGIGAFYKFQDDEFPEMKTIFLASHWMPLPEPPKE